MVRAPPPTLMIDLLLYYVGAFLLEDDLFRLVLSARGRRLLRRSRLFSLEFALVHYPILCCFWVLWLPSAVAEAVSHCKAHPICGRYAAVLYADAVDLSDGQWRAYRGSLATLLLFAVCTVAVGKAASAARLPRERRWLVDLAVGLGLLVFLHGGGAMWHFFLVLTFHAFARTPALTWVLTISVLVLKEPRLARELRLAPLLGIRLGGALDSWRGAYPWHSSVGLVLLRLVSYATERHKAAAMPRDAAKRLPEPPPHAFTLPRLLAYVNYAPLFLAGPTLTFTAYQRDRAMATTTERAASSEALGGGGHTARADRRAATTTSAAAQLGKKSAPATGEGAAWLALYAVRLAAVHAALEHALRRYPVFAIANSCLGSLPPTAAAAAVFLLLNVMWLKFCAIWRLARLWATLDGVHAPENMLRCLCNSYSISGFWRGWHASFNSWCLAYIYSPLRHDAGMHRAVATALTFAFTALWHDIEPKLLVWGGLNILALTLERAVTAAVAEPLRRALGGGPAGGGPPGGGTPRGARGGWRWRQLRAAGGACNIVVLVLVNAIGYVGGFSALRGVGGGLGDGAGFDAASHGRLAAVTFATFFAGTHVMLELREVEEEGARAAGERGGAAGGGRGGKRGREEGVK